MRSWAPPGPATSIAGLGVQHELQSQRARPICRGSDGHGGKTHCRCGTAPCLYDVLDQVVGFFCDRKPAVPLPSAFVGHLLQSQQIPHVHDAKHALDDGTGADDVEDRRTVGLAVFVFGSK